jgi:hypothetical protein
MSKAKKQVSAKMEEHIRLCTEYGVDPKVVPIIHSFEDGCAETGGDPTKLPEVAHLPARHQKRLIADYKLAIIGEALRKKKNVDYTNSREWKHFPVFSVEANKQHPSGFGLSYYDFGSWYSFSVVGVRHCFQEEDVAIFYGKHFIELHKDHHLYT